VSKRSILDLNNIPLDSSLGHLAIGDIAFEAWRKMKQENNKEQNKEKKK